jgi:hypothetical protein
LLLLKSKKLQLHHCMYLTTILAQHLDMQIKTVGTVCCILIFDKLIYNLNVMLCSLVHRYEYFKQTCHLLFQDKRRLQCGSSKFL